MAEDTPRFRLPYILPGQAQKEMSHNEALARIDACLAPHVEGIGINSPPAALEGQAWIVGVTPTGAWAGNPNSIAVFSEGGWRFIAPLPGMMIWSVGDDLYVRWTGTGWSIGVLPVAGLMVQGQPMLAARRPAIPGPAGGGTVDAEARARIADILNALRAHGLIFS